MFQGLCKVLIHDYDYKNRIKKKKIINKFSNVKELCTAPKCLQTNNLKSVN